MKAYIYYITNKINNKKYIGQTININNRLSEHFSSLRKNKHHSIKLQRAFNKYGEENFEVSYKEFEADSIEDLHKIEQIEIAKNDSYNNGYNMTIGGEGNPLKLNYEDRIIIYNLLLKYDGIKHILSKYYNIDRTVLTTISRNEKLKEEQYNKDKYNLIIKECGITDDYLKENYINNYNRKIKFEDGLAILCLIEFNKEIRKTLCEILNIQSKTLYNIEKGNTYKDVFEYYQNLTNEEKKEINDEYFIKWNVQEIKEKRFKKQFKKEPLTEEELKYIIQNPDNLTRKELQIKFDRSDTTIRDIQNGKVYYKYYKKYKLPE